MVHFHNLDSLQHRLWPYLDVDETGLRVPGWNEEVESCLRALDETVGRLMELASRRDAAVIAVSDHGFGPCRALVNVNGLLRDAGLQRGLMYGTRFRYRARRLGDRLRRWMTRRAPGGSGRRLPRSIEGQVGCDWKRTVAFAPFGQLSGCIFLNPRTDRDVGAPSGSAREVIEACRDARDPETGDPLFSDVFAVADRYGSTRPPRACPRSSPSRPTATRRRPSGASRSATSCSAPIPNLPGTHWSEGIIAIDAPDVRPGGHLRADLHDVAPTALAMLGLPRPREHGRPRAPRSVREPACRSATAHAPRSNPTLNSRTLLAAGFGAECA